MQSPHTTTTGADIERVVGSNFSTEGNLTHLETLPAVAGVKTAEDAGFAEAVEHPDGPQLSRKRLSDPGLQVVPSSAVW